MQPAACDNGVGNQLGGPDAKMDALIARLDRIAAVAEKSSASIYGRRLNTVDFANPGEVTNALGASGAVPHSVLYCVNHAAPIGLFSFGIGE